MVVKHFPIQKLGKKIEIFTTAVNSFNIEDRQKVERTFLFYDQLTIIANFIIFVACITLAAYIYAT